jgi:NADP-dependent 3-hydroxy acid dehydrogenase YdfG
MATLAVIGAGPGLGRSIARRFGAAGFDVALLARNPGNLGKLAAELGGLGITARGYAADVTDRTGLATALERAAADLGSINTLVFNPAPGRPPAPADRLGPEDALPALERQVLGAIAAVNAVLPAMRERGAGSLLFTMGASALYPVPFMGPVGIASAGLRNYVLAIRQPLAAQGVFAALVEIDLLMSHGGGEADPDSIAEQIYRLHCDRDRSELKIGNLLESAAAINSEAITTQR